MADDVVALPPAPRGRGRAALVLLILYAAILISEFLAPYGLHTRNIDFIFAPPQRGPSLRRRASSSAPSSMAYDYTLDLENLKRVYTPDPDKVAAAALLLPGRQLQVLGLDRRRSASRLPGRRRDPVPRSAPTGSGATCSAPHHLRRADLAHHRPDRRLGQLRARHRHSAASPAITAAGSITSSSASSRSCARSRICRCGWRCRRSCRSTGARC